MVVDYPEHAHLEPDVIAFARSLPHPGKYRKPSVCFRDIDDQLHDTDGFAYPGTAKQADLSTLEEGLNQVDHFNARDEHLHFCRLIFKSRRMTMNRIAERRLHRPALIDGVADDIDDPPERAIADRHSDRSPGVDRLHSSDHALGRKH